MENFYKIYQYNIWHLINTYKLKYYWLNLNENFYNGVEYSLAHEFHKIGGNPWINRSIDNKKLLGKNILEIGTFTPIFYQKINNKRYVIIGKHRLYSLLLNNLFYPIDKKFLFIELPNKENPITLQKQKLYNLKSSNNLKFGIPKNMEEINCILYEFGDNLTSYLWKNNCKPFSAFNNEEKFVQWLNTPIEEIKETL